MTTTPESITVSFEWAEKLEKAGLCDDAHFYWVKREQAMTKDWVLLPRQTWEAWKINNPKMKFRAAYTAEEILRRLPYGYVVGYAIGSKNNLPLGDAFCRNEGMPSQKDTKFSDTLANAAAAMFCFLAENNLLPPQ